MLHLKYLVCHVTRPGLSVAGVVGGRGGGESLGNRLGKAGRQELYKIKTKIETLVEREDSTETLEILWESIPTCFTVQNIIVLINAYILENHNVGFVYHTQSFRLASMA
jgi:hypothetical protein